MNIIQIFALNNIYVKKYKKGHLSSDNTITNITKMPKLLNNINVQYTKILNNTKQISQKYQKY